MAKGRRNEPSMWSAPQAISPLRTRRRGNHTIANLEQEPRLLVDRLGSLPGARGGYHPHVALPHLPAPLRVLGRRATVGNLIGDGSGALCFDFRWIFRPGS